MYDTGTGVPRDHAQALFWYRTAADQGDAGAQYNLGADYHLKEDYAHAMQWYRKAADQGVALAQFLVGSFYRSGQGVPRDDSQALAWFRKAADQGLGFAQFQIGLMYLAGEGVPLNYGTAMTWFRKAADDSTGGLHPIHDLDKINRSKAAADYAIGRMYATGTGVPKDTAQAIAWFQKAAALGHAEAKASLAELQRPTSANEAGINWICRDARGTTLVSVDAALKSVKVQTGTVLEYRDGADQYVTITDSAIEFGCRKIRSQEEVFGDGLAWMLGRSKTKENWASTLCLARNRIDRTTGIWTATGSGSVAGMQNDTAECSLAGSKR